MRWWYAYVPLHLAGSGGRRLVAKFQATAEEVIGHFASSARIDPVTGVLEFFKRP